MGEVEETRPATTDQLCSPDSTSDNWLEFLRFDLVPWLSLACRTAEMPMKENAVKTFGEQANSSVCGFWIKGRVVDKAMSSPKKWELSLVSTSVLYF